MKGLCWLASYPKSGNTWVKLFLEAYKTGKVDINDLNFVVGDEKVYYYQLVTPVPYHVMDLYGWSVIRPAALHNVMLFNQAKDQIVVKTHCANMTVGNIPLFPQPMSSRSVYMVRNPLDVAPSYARHIDVSVDETIGYMQRERHGGIPSVEVLRNFSFMSSWDNHVNSWMAYPDILVVRYENLVSDPEQWFTKILEQYCIEVDAKRLQEAMDLTTLDKLIKQEEDNGFLEATHGKFFGAKKEKLTQDQTNAIIDAFGDIMVKLGYLEAEVKAGAA